jgi:hypothetical protein
VFGPEDFACTSEFGALYPKAAFWLGDISRDGRDEENTVRTGIADVDTTDTRNRIRILTEIEPDWYA